MARIPSAFIDELIERVNLVDVVASHVDLKKTGKNYQACCPLPGHDEKTPSFTVIEDKQFYNCFGCGEHGNVIDFLTKAKGLDFIGAIKELCTLTGMTIPKPSAPKNIDKKHQAKKQVLNAVYKLGQRGKSDKKYEDLLVHLNITKKQADQFDIGFLSKEQDIYRQLTNQEQIKAAVELGFITTNDTNTFKDDLLLITTQIREHLVGVTIFKCRDEQLHIGLNGQGKERLLHGPSNKRQSNKAQVFTHVIDLIHYDGPDDAFAVTTHEHLLTKQQITELSRSYEQINLRIREGETKETLLPALPCFTSTLNVSIGTEEQGLTDWILEDIEDQLLNTANITANDVQPILEDYRVQLTDPIWMAALTYEVGVTYGLSISELQQPVKLKKNNSQSSEEPTSEEPASPPSPFPIFSI